MDAVAVVQTVVIAVIGGILIKIIWDWFVSGRMKKGEYYMTTTACTTCREQCCISAVKFQLQEHLKEESGHTSEVNTRLKNIEKSLDESKETSEKLRSNLEKTNLAMERIASALEAQKQSLFNVYKKVDETL